MADMLPARLIEAMVARVAAFLIQPVLAEGFEGFGEAFGEAFDKAFGKAVGSAKKTFS